MSKIDVVDMVDKHLVGKNTTRRELRDSRQVGRYWPSEASIQFTNQYGETETCGKCARCIYYSITDGCPTNPPDAVGIRKMRAGNLFEDEERRIGEEMGIIIKEDDFRRRFKKQLDNGITISGEIDVLYNFDGKYYIGEIKSGYGYMFGRDIIKYGKPKDVHIMQLAIYLDAFKDKVKGGILLYIDRGDATKRAFEVNLLENGLITIDGTVHQTVTLSRIYDRIKYVHKCMMEGKAPKGDYTPHYSPATIEHRFNQGRVPKTHYNNYKKGKRAWIGDFYCHYCDYLQKCLDERGFRDDL